MSQGLARLCLPAMLLLLGACASGPMPAEISTTPPPGIHLGNEIALLDAPPAKTVAHMTPDGRVHVVAIMDGGDAVHLVVSGRGVERKEKIGAQRYNALDNLAITDDAGQRVHLALKDEHWIFDSGAWRLAGDNRCARLARAGTALACIAAVDANELGLPGQWGVTVIGGGFGAALPIPYRTPSLKLVAGEAAGEGWSWRTVLDHSAFYGVNLEGLGGGFLAGDGSGRFHLLFMAREGNRDITRYATLRFGDAAMPGVEWRRPDGQAVPLANLDSVVLRSGEDWATPWMMLALAVDPNSGTALYFARQMKRGGETMDASLEIRDGRLGREAPIPVARGIPWRLAPAGKERFHALASVRPGLAYLAYRDGSLSEPILIGEYGTPRMSLSSSNIVRIASDGRSEALAIWPKREGGLVGRWIRID